MTTYNLSTTEIKEELVKVRNDIWANKQKLLALEAQLNELDDLRNSLVLKMEGNPHSHFEVFQAYSKSQDAVREQSVQDQKLNKVIDALVELIGGA